LQFIKASIADLITLLFSSLQNSEGGSDNLTFSLSPSLLRPLAKNLLKQKSLLGAMRRKSKQKNRKKGF
jgi:hypothetical protein